MQYQSCHDNDYLSRRYEDDISIVCITHNTFFNLQCDVKPVCLLACHQIMIYWLIIFIVVISDNVQVK